ncbi:MAG: MOSC domain-containing protein [Cyclobacteriaceae bacterium]
MKVVSVNIGEKQTIIWRKQEVTTGIFKYPVDHAIRLESEDVVNDHVVDRRFHGGIDKACYLFSLDHYAHYKERFPDATWSMGMFGENITVDGLVESSLKIGSRYRVGTAEIEISQPRQPCSKLGVRFDDPLVLKEMINSYKCGSYVRVIQAGDVTVGDEFELISASDGLSIKDIFQLLYGKHMIAELAGAAVADDRLASSAREELKKRYTNIDPQ